ncbi:MAG: efflux RND transporter periplasmic adaptor subunit [Bacteroidetes bacterium]|nr:efflux RND transporter periplasmic adaptor subunit [Flavobacteriaceae bacterium]MDA0863805.1 efflux RND transporter periplasmic adaptor subunit [Bacteroidota bacterium]
MNKYILLSLWASLSLLSCQEKKQTVEQVIATNDLAQLRAQRAAIGDQHQALSQDLEALDRAIGKLDQNEKLSLVTALVISPERFEHYLQVQGDVATKQNIVLYPQFSGQLQTLHVSVGDQVKKGDLLATLDDNGMAQQLNQLMVQEALAKTTFERQEKLWHQNIGSELQYLQAKTQYEAQRSLTQQVSQQLEKSKIVAPFDGTIDAVLAEAGTVVSAGMSPVFRLVNLSNMYLKADVPEGYLNDVVAGKKVIVNFPVLRLEVPSKIRSVGRYINPDNRTFSVEVDLPNNKAQIKPNLTAQININDYTNDQALLVPQSVISENAAGEQYVYTTQYDQERNQSMAKKQMVVTGKTEGDFVEIIQGIQPGDTVIAEGARSVKDGQPISILKTITHE